MLWGKELCPESGYRRSGKCLGQSMLLLNRGLNGVAERKQPIDRVYDTRLLGEAGQVDRSIKDGLLVLIRSQAMRRSSGVAASVSA
jgi:hypothetical protein